MIDFNTLNFEKLHKDTYAYQKRNPNSLLFYSIKFGLKKQRIRLDNPYHSNKSYDDLIGLLLQFKIIEWASYNWVVTKISKSTSK